MPQCLVQKILRKWNVKNFLVSFPSVQIFKTCWIIKIISSNGIEQLRGREVETSLIYSDNINTDVNIKQTYEQTQWHSKQTTLLGLDIGAVSFFFFPSSLFLLLGVMVLKGHLVDGEVGRLGIFVSKKFKLKLQKIKLKNNECWACPSSHTSQSEE